MEFFEKAHIAKPKDFTRNVTKTGEQVKKQLKQMLDGYKNSDIQLIRESEHLKKDLEDSSSVSGVSDLSLTNSSFEVNESLDKGLSDPLELDIESNSDEDSALSDSKPTTVPPCKHPRETDKVRKNKEFEENLQDQSCSVSLSECKEDVGSLSDDGDASGMDDLMLDGFSVNTTSVSSEIEEEEEEAFDRDGALAAKILKKLEKTDKNVDSKGKKRKCEEVIIGDAKYIKNKNIDKKSDTNVYKGPFRPPGPDDDFKEELIALEKKMCRIKLPKRIPVEEYEESGHLSDESVDIDELDLSLSKNSEDFNVSNITDSTEDQTPFESILAGGEPAESLNDVLGDYCHPTVRNLPFESQNIYPTNDLEIFTSEDAFVSDINDDVGSLVPEVDNNETVDDIDLPTDLDTSSQQPNEESTVYDETIQSDNISDQELSADIDPPLINPVKVYYGKNSCILVLKHPAQVFMHGKLKVKCLGGSVEMNGFVLKDGTYEVYAPSYNFAHCIETVENTNTYYGLFGKLTGSGLTVSDAEDIVTSIEEYDGVINLQPLRSRKIDFVQSNFNTNDLFEKQSKNIDNCLKRASDFLGCSLYLSKPWKNMQEQAVWKEVIQHGLASQQSKGVICGGKGAGKSTFLRYYVNRLLSQGPILVLDLDPGQCEFTGAGNLSATVVYEPLLGPNFTHLKTPEFSLHLGMINTMDHPRRYIAGVEALIAHCYADDRLKNIPWVVNTMGMTNSLGLKFISYAILKIKPTFLFQIDSRNQKKRFDFHLYPQTIKNLYFEDFQNDYLFKNVTEADVDYQFFISTNVESTGKSNFSLPPRDERYLNFLAYFGELLDSHRGDLLGIVPYEVDLQDLGVVLNVRIGAEGLTSVLNGKVVALCSGAPRGLSVLGERPLRCYGFGLIRGIDVEKGKLYIISPSMETGMDKVDSLVYADWIPELRGTERALPEGTPVPYRTASLYQQRQLMFAPKRRFNPLQLLKMSRS